jgi:hypothetical protein
VQRQDLSSKSLRYMRKRRPRPFEETSFDVRNQTEHRFLSMKIVSLSPHFPIQTGRFDTLNGLLENDNNGTFILADDREAVRQ